MFTCSSRKFNSKLNDSLYDRMVLGLTPLSPIRYSVKEVQGPGTVSEIRPDVNLAVSFINLACQFLEIIQ